MIRSMIKNELHRISTELDTNGYALTSYVSLGLDFDPNLVARLCDSAAEGGFSSVAADWNQINPLLEQAYNLIDARTLNAPFLTK
jgi:hypothetical protein